MDQPITTDGNHTSRGRSPNGRSDIGRAIWLDVLDAVPVRRELRLHGVRLGRPPTRCRVHQ